MPAVGVSDLRRECQEELLGRRPGADGWVRSASHEKEEASEDDYGGGTPRE